MVAWHIAINFNMLIAIVFYIIFECKDTPYINRQEAQWLNLAKFGNNHFFAFLESLYHAI